MMRLFEPVTLLAVGLVVDGLTQDSTQVVLPQAERVETHADDTPTNQGDAMKLRIALAGTVAAAAALTTLGLATAASGGPAPGTVQPHQHYVVTETGTWVPVGPDACNDGPSLQFDNFHFNIHKGQPFENGIISFTGCDQAPPN